MQVHIPERRMHNRFELVLPMKIRTVGKTPILASGMTKNISSGGVLFLCDAALSPASVIRYQIRLQGRPAVTMLCGTGEVLRLSRTGKKAGGRAQFSVAATLRRYRFERLKRPKSTVAGNTGFT